MRFCFTALTVSLVAAGCRRAELGDACALLTRADVEKALGTTVKGTTIEAPHAMSVSAGRVMQTTASCAYSLDPAPGKPPAVKIQVDVFGDHMMAVVNWGPWKGAQHVGGIGDDAWQGGGGLKVIKGNAILLIETPYTPAEPTSEAASPEPDIQLYPRIQIELARIALGRL